MLSLSKLTMCVSMQHAPMSNSIEQGAATTLYGCLAPALPLSFNGAYLADCDVGTPDAKMADPELRKALWETTEAQINEVMK